MLLPSIKQIIDLHSNSLKRFGGEAGLLNKDGLLSYPNQMEQALYFGKKDVIGLATWILIRLIQNHYFVDGNKRVGLGTFLTFLKSNECYWNLPYKEYFFDLVMRIASNEGDDIMDGIEQDLREILTCD